jgi:WD40 repeat protein
MSSKDVLEPELKIEKIKSLPLACIKPATCMKFINETQRLCYITNRSCLLCLKIIDNDEILLESCIQCIQDITLTDNRVYMMKCKGDFVATADTDLNVIIWNLKTQDQVCILPRYERMSSSMCFDNKNSNLFVCYSNRKVCFESKIIENLILAFVLFILVY